MDYLILKFTHLIGLSLMAGGLMGVFVSDLRSRQLQDLHLFAEAVRNIGLFYDGLVVPGALILLVSGTWFIISFYGGWDFLRVPWLAGMVALFTFEFIEGNTVTRLYFMKLRRLTRQAVDAGFPTPALEVARAERIPSFTHFLDIPLLLVIVSLGALKPDTWTLAIIGVLVALAVAGVLTFTLTRLYPWQPSAH